MQVAEPVPLQEQIQKTAVQRPAACVSHHRTLTRRTATSLPARSNACASTALRVVSRLPIATSVGGTLRPQRRAKALADHSRRYPRGRSPGPLRRRHPRRGADHDPACTVVAGGIHRQLERRLLADDPCSAGQEIDVSLQQVLWSSNAARLARRRTPRARTCARANPHAATHSHDLTSLR